MSDDRLLQARQLVGAGYQALTGATPDPAKAQACAALASALLLIHEFETGRR